jgi:hypothetical protein
VVLIDLENILFNTDLADPTSFSLEDGLERLMRQLGRLGRIVKVFVFAPIQTANIRLDVLYGLGFCTIVCPRVVVDKTGAKDEKRDTVDPALIDFGKLAISEMPDLTHLCLCSGDQDFIPLLREAQRQGLKIIIVAGGGKPESLSKDLAKYADKDPSGSKMIYFFSAKAENGDSA